MPYKYFLLLIISTAGHYYLSAQEKTVPLLFNSRVAIENEQKSKSLKRTEPITLPMIETFYYYEDSAIPSDEWWIDGHVYINNHYADNHFNKGIATFDAIDQYGKPYADINPWEQKLCDSLTSYYIDLSGYEAGDSLYLSFDYLAGGLGFKPKAYDSLIVYLRDSINGWQKVDFINNPSVNYWQTKMIPIKNSSYFYTHFQFRIVNKGTIGLSGSQWHIDNVILDAGRQYTDNKYNNYAFTGTPTSFFKDFTSMPWKHYNTARSSFTNDSIFYFTHFQHTLNPLISTTVDYSVNLNGGPALASGSMPLTVLESESKRSGFPNFDPASIPGISSLENILNVTYTLNPPADDAFEWDNVIIKKNIFSNYLAYDDGNSEQAYFLNLSPGLRGEVAVEYACYVPDTLAGIQIQFVPQIPYGEDKEFYIRIYKSIEVGGSSGELIYEQSGNFPVYTADNQGIVLYTFDELIPLPTGIFYVSVMMPASGMSDSLMIGLDMHRSGGNHRYYNVLDIWESSLIDGAVMIRPVFSGSKLSTEIHKEQDLFSLYPNPADDKIYIQSIDYNNNHTYYIYDIGGRIQLHGKYDGEGIDIQHLNSGIYFITTENELGLRSHKKFIKK